MSTGYINTAEDTDMAECEEEKVVTMMDVLQEQEEFEEDANAVLGASDDKNCTYSKGYIKRQAVYACLTCCPDVKTDPTKRAGVCLACSLNCHENHELIELYTRRNFRCDCGNPKFNSHPCLFTPNKMDLNEDNKYNQNFIGTYCTCQRPYPDPDAIIEDEMIQCTICEDWLHASHLEATLPSNDQYSEMICKACMEMNEFLHDYSYLAINIDREDVDITLNDTVTIESNEKLSNGSFGLLPTCQETSNSETINTAMETSKKNEAMKYKSSYNTSNIIEKETNINGTVIESNGDNENETEKMLEEEKKPESKEIDPQTQDATIADKTGEVEQVILHTNKLAALNNTLDASDKGMAIETGEKQEFLQRNTDNIQKESVLVCTTLSEIAVLNTNMVMVGGVISELNNSNLEVSNIEGRETFNTPEISSNENEAVFKAQKTTENSAIKHPGNHFHLENSNSQSSCEYLQKIDENEPLIVPKTDQAVLIQSNDMCSKTHTSLKDLEGNETDKANPLHSTEVNIEVDTALKYLETNHSGARIEDNPIEVKEKNEENPLQSMEVTSEKFTPLKNVENSKFESKIEEQSTETQHKETGKMDISEPTEVNTNVDITLNNFVDSVSGTEPELLFTETIDKETGKKDISVSAEFVSNIDIILNKLEDKNPGTKTEEQSTEANDKETNKMDISESTEVDTKVDIALNSLIDCESGTKEDQSTEKINTESGRKDILDSTEVVANIDIILNNLEDRETGTKTKEQSTENNRKGISNPTEIDTDTKLNNLEYAVSETKNPDQSIELIDKESDKKNMLESTKFDSSIDTLINNSETKLEQEGTEKINVNISEESVDQSDTLEKATKELLELTSDMVEESEGNLLLESNDTANTNKELNSSEELTETHIPMEADNKKNTDIEMNNLETDECVNRNSNSQVETPSCNKAKVVNEHKRKHNDQKEDVAVKKARLEENKCLRPKGMQKIFRGATFWPSDLRQKLCTCNVCLTMYKDLKLLFLLDPEDTVTAYETLGKEKINGTPTTQYEKGLQALSSLDRVQQINALTEYNIMRDKLLDFLKSFKEKKEVVKEEDIRAFFAGMKPRREPDGVYFCR